MNRLGQDPQEIERQEGCSRHSNGPCALRTQRSGNL